MENCENCPTCGKKLSIKEQLELLKKRVEELEKTPQITITPYIPIQIIPLPWISTPVYPSNPIFPLQYPNPEITGPLYEDPYRYTCSYTSDTNCSFSMN